MSAKFVMMLSREVRRVPMDYEPPDSNYGVFDEFYDVALAEWREAKRRWDSREDPDAVKHSEYSYAEWAGDEPDPKSYLPGSAWPADAVMGIRMYETVSEGSPISTAYPDTPKGRADMAAELASKSTGVTSVLTAADWLEVISESAAAPVGTDLHTAAPVRF